MAILSALPTAFSFSLSQTANIDATKHHEGEELWSPEFWSKIGFSICLVLLGGVFSGSVNLDLFFVARVIENVRLLMLAAVSAWGRAIRLTLGLMGLDELHLRVLSASSDDDEERKNAARGERSTLRDLAVDAF